MRHFVLHILFKEKGFSGFSLFLLHISFERIM